MTFYTSAEGASDIFLCVGYLIRISISHVDFEKIERIIVQKCATYEIIVAFFSKTAHWLFTCICVICPMKQSNLHPRGLYQLQGLDSMLYVTLNIG